MNRHLKAIELDKILELLAQECMCEESLQRAAALRPSGNRDYVKILLAQTEDAYSLIAKFGGPNFRGISDVNAFLSRATAGGALNMRELLRTAQMLRGVRLLKEWRNHCEGVKTSLDKYFEGLYANHYLEERIFACILSEDEMADNASPELYSIRRKMREASAKIRNQLDHMIHSGAYSKYLQDSVVTFRGGRFVVPVKSEYRSEVPGMVHDTSATGATLFVEPAGVVNLNNDIKVLEGKERDEMERILMELSAETAAFAEHIRASFKNALELDLIFAKAQLAFKMRASMPLINDEGIIDIGKARHPLISKDAVVPIDVRLGKDFSTLVITGPNTGGKTVSIKTIGLFCAMAMCGLMLPCADESKVSVFDKILVDIGDEQSIEQSLSTFSGHMTNIIDILQVADAKSLVLIDELGAGTDPVEGAALAEAILEQLRMQGAKIAATTHYAEIKQYALETDGVENASCEFDVDSLKPTYKLVLGIPGRSNAFAISQRLGMDDAIIQKAEKLISGENRRFETVVEKVEKSRMEFESKTKEAALLSEKAKRDSEQAKKLKEEVQTLRDKELEKAKTEAKRITEKAKRESQALLDELNRLKREEHSAQERARLAKQKINKSIDALEDLTADEFALIDDEYRDYQLPRDVKVGDNVFCKSFHQAGTVLTAKNASGMVEVQMGFLKSRVKQDDLVLLDKKPTEKPKRRSVSARNERFEQKVSSAVNNRCDLRGKTAEEARDALDIFMDRAIMDGLGEATIIHGKGSGVLRSMVQQYLRKNKRIKSFRLGVYGEGEDGVTIVEFK
ncbi:MAG: endonuclease MutS2 [Ruminococcaceae bacterium]|nr:endonuclease MutS2 [Oscillospiraceae bacterium]